MLFAGVRGYLDKLDTKKIADFEAKWIAFVTSTKADILATIKADGQVSKETEAKLVAAMDEFLGMNDFS